MQDLSISLVQANPLWQNVEENLKYFSALISQSGLLTDVIALPEMFSTGFTMESGKMAEPMNGRTHVWMQEQAFKLNSVICGSLIIIEDGNYYNRFLWVEPNGITCHYDKRHLFRMANENDSYSPGLNNFDINYKGWKVRPQICYDLRFPVWSRNSATEDVFAYDILLYCANWPQARITAWDALLKARAIENSAFCIGVNRVGEDGLGTVYNGHSAAFSPKGQQLCFMGNMEDFQTITLKKVTLSDYRKKFPVFMDSDNFRLDL